jgi:hypothetical protein
MGEKVVHGIRNNNSEPIDSVDDSGVERLAVDAKLTSGFVAEVNLDETTDEVAVYGGIDGSETADAATRQILNVDSAGRQRVVGAAADGSPLAGNPVLIAGSDLTNARPVVVVADNVDNAGTSATPRNLQVIAKIQGFDGTTWDRIRGDATNGLDVDVTRISSNDGTDIGDVTVNNAAGASAVNIQDGGNSITIDAADLDIRNLTHVASQDSIRIGDGTDLANVTTAGELNVIASAQPGVDIGDVTVNNAAGAAAVNIQDGGNSITIDGTVAATQGSPPWTVEGAAADGTAVAGNNPLLIAGQDGTNIQSARTDTTGNLGIYQKTSTAAMADAVSNTHTFLLDEAGGAFVRTIVRGELYNGSTWDRQPGNTSGAFVQGPAAHDAAIAGAGNPQLFGANALAHGSSPTAVAAGDLTRVQANRHGIQFAIGGHPNVQTFRLNRAAAGDADIITVAAGNKAVVTRVSVTVDEACTVGVGFRVGFATAAAAPTGAGCLLSHPGLVPGGGITIGDGSGILGVGADDEDIVITNDAVTGGSLDVNVSYYLIES